MHIGTFTRVCVCGCASCCRSLFYWYFAKNTNKRETTSFLNIYSSSSTARDLIQQLFGYLLLLPTDQSQPSLSLALWNSCSDSFRAFGSLLLLPPAQHFGYKSVEAEFTPDKKKTKYDPDSRRRMESPVVDAQCGWKSFTCYWHRKFEILVVVRGGGHEIIRTFNAMIGADSMNFVSII